MVIFIYSHGTGFLSSFVFDSGHSLCGFHEGDTNKVIGINSTPRPVFPKRLSQGLGKMSNTKALNIILNPG